MDSTDHVTEHVQELITQTCELVQRRRQTAGADLAMDRALEALCAALDANIDDCRDSATRDDALEMIAQARASAAALPSEPLARAS